MLWCHFYKGGITNHSPMFSIVIFRRETMLLLLYVLNEKPNLAKRSRSTDTQQD